jgi:hypothetical protein
MWRQLWCRTLLLHFKADAKQEMLIAIAEMVELGAQVTCLSAGADGLGTGVLGSHSMTS